MHRIFDIDFKKLLLAFLPFTLRRKGVFALFEALLTGVKTTYLSFRINRNANNDDIVITPQTYSLQKMLNDRFDNVHRAIRIEDTSAFERTYIFRSSENRPLYINADTFLYLEQEIKKNLGFLVKVPLRIYTASEDARIKNLVGRYKLAGTKFLVEYE